MGQRQARLDDVVAPGARLRLRVARGMRACCGHGFAPFEDLELAGRVLTVTNGEALLVVDGIGGPTLWATFMLDDVDEAGEI